MSDGLVDRTKASKLDFPSVLRVASWNIWWRYGPWKDRRTAIETTLKEVKADVVALQEVWDEAGSNLAAALAEELAFDFAYQRSEKRDGVGFGNAILSRWPIATTDWRPLPGRLESGEGRSVLFAEVSSTKGPLQVFVTHLNWRFEHSAIRQRQVTEILRFVSSKARPNHPPIVCGDFNAEPQSDEIRMMTGHRDCRVAGTAFRDAWLSGGDGGVGYTWDNRNEFAAVEHEPNRRIDYVLVGPPGDEGEGKILSCRLAGDEPVDGIWPSDHFSVVADLQF